MIPNGDLWAWGYNGQGQLGDGTTTHRLNPAIVQTDVLKLFSDGMTSHNYGYVIQNFILKSDGLWGCGGTSLNETKVHKQGVDNV